MAGAGRSSCSSVEAGHKGLHVRRALAMPRGKEHPYFQDKGCCARNLDRPCCFPQFLHLAHNPCPFTFSHNFLLFIKPSNNTDLIDTENKLVVARDSGGGRGVVSGRNE